jgi:hypothetical protein
MEKEMVKLRHIGGHKLRKPGSIYLKPKDEADKLIVKGHAELVVEKKKPVKTDK